MKTCILLIFALSLCTTCLFAQTDANFVESEDTHYFDFWPGTWIEVVDGAVDSSATRFVVKKSVNPASFEEEWIQVYDGSSHRSVALRSWDQVNNRWAFVWVSDNALFQVWDGVKIDGDWYITKEFVIDGKSIHSRQAWIPLGGSRLRRILQRSEDGGQTWFTRYESIFVKVE